MEPRRARISIVLNKHIQLIGWLNVIKGKKMKWKYNLFTILFFCCGSVLLAQPAIQWQKSLGGSGYDEASSIQQTNDGGYIVAGRSSSTDGHVSGNHGGEDVWVVRLASNGAILWQKSYGGTGNDVASVIENTTDGGYVMAGRSTSTNGDVTGNHGGEDFWVVKISLTGTLQWQKSLGGSGDDRAHSIKQTFDGGYIIAGRSGSSDGDVSKNQGSDDYWVVKLTNTGALDWEKSFGGTGYDEGNSIRQTADSGYIVAGRSSSYDGDVTSNHGSLEYWLLKLSVAGDIQWDKSLGGLVDDEAYSIQTTFDGGYVVAGWSNSNNGDVSGNHGNEDYWVAKLTSKGDMEWERSMGGSKYDIASHIIQTLDSGYMVTGWSASEDGDVTGHHGSTDYWMVKLTKTGEIWWQKALGGTSYELASAIIQSTDGGYVVAGGSFSNDGEVTGNSGSTDFWIVKLTSVVGIDEFAGINRSLFYPNPTSGQITIHTEAELVGSTYIISNTLGKVVLSGKLASTNAILDIGNLSSGIYQIRLGDQNVQTFKFIKD